MNQVPTINNQEQRSSNQEPSPSPSDGEVLVRVEHVSKKFCRSLKTSLWYGIQDIAHELNPFARPSPRTKNQEQPALRASEFWAVNDVSFELRRGECLGLIGHNGAGKTTLLKMLNGLIKPDSGRIEMRGRIGALIALGAGFNPILTGRENIYINASILGLRKKEIDAKIEEIIDFADITDFIDSPVQSYSSGMTVRLGFAVATALEPDILIIDEVLAVGDAKFRSKCYEKIDSLRENTSIIFVSHNMAQVARLCTKSLLLDHGRIAKSGNTPNCILEYDHLQLSGLKKTERHGTGMVTIKSITFYNQSNQSCAQTPYGAPLTIKLELQAAHIVPELVVDIGFRTIGSELVAECNNYVTAVQLSIQKPSSNIEVIAHIKALPINPGVYQISCFLMNKEMITHYDWWEGAATLEINSGRPAIAGTQLIADWQLFQ